MTPIETGVKVPVTSDTSVPPSDEGGKKVASSARKRTRKADSPPKSRPDRPKAEAAFSTAELQQALAEILTFPAVPCGMAGDEWGVEHFTTQGHAFAAQLAKQAEKNATLYKWCVRIAQGESMGMLGLAGCMYLLPPLVHWGLIPMPAQAQGLIPGMPPVKEPDPTTSTAAQHMAPEPGSSSNGSNATGNTGKVTP